MVNLEWYRTFKAIYQHGTLTRAAEELMISQPSASMHLASLETYVGHPLFIRLPRRMEPTEWGKKLYTMVVEPIDSLGKVEAEFRRSKLGQVPTIRFGVPPELFLNYLARHIGALSPMLEVHYGLAGELIGRLESGCLQIAVITKPPQGAGRLSYEPLLTERFMVVAGAGFDTSPLAPLVQGGNLQAIERGLREQPWHVYSNDLAMVRRFWKINFGKRPLVKPVATIPDNNALLESLASNRALAVASDLIAGPRIAAGQVQVVWQGVQPTTNTLYLAFDKAKVDPLQVAQVRAWIEEVMQL